MALRIEDKKQIVEEVSAVAANALSAVTAEYRGLAVEEMTELRATARKTGVKLQVVRNTLAKRAVKGTQFECLDKALVGPIILAFADEDPGAAARLFRDFSKDHEKLVVTALAVDGELLDSKQLGAVASLPTRDEAIAKLMSVLQAPIVKLVRTMAEPHAELVRTVAAVRDQKQQQGDA